jgi:hypothetical protein
MPCIWKKFNFLTCGISKRFMPYAAKTISFASQFPYKVNDPSKQKFLERNEKY